MVVTAAWRPQATIWLKGQSVSNLAPINRQARAQCAAGGAAHQQMKNYNHNALDVLY
jgi:hypothetical protein